MRFKIGDKVTVCFLPRNISNWSRQVLGKSGIIVKKCYVRDCFVVEFNNPKTKQTRHLHKNCISLSNIKNQQLLFNFYYESEKL